MLLRSLVASDVDALVSYRSLPDVCRWVPFQPMDADTVLARISNQWSGRTLQNDGDALILGVEIAATSELVGDLMLLYSSSVHRSAEIGYVFHPDHAGHGYATEASHELLHVAFDELAAHRVMARVDPRNHASVGVLRRLGMREEAHLIENEWFKGEWGDELDFAVLSREWHARGDAACP